MNYLRLMVASCGILVVAGLLFLGTVFGVSIVRSPRELTERMIGASLPEEVTPDVQFDGLLGPIPIDIEYEAHVRFTMPAKELDGFVERLGCPSIEKVGDKYECIITRAQRPSGLPPSDGTAESRLIQFKLLDNQTVLVQMRLLAT
ncbi:hypothetical protein [Thermocoleostomius sinensis]|uniref:Uncharacterized protein n=1 Tax=Thermocoleostomius sinensis A174 TaxID=2016057 RepID=A0A9E8ZK57_9CYAN|nr:hypothetical protein [Thermocoleostomius sinensis]WAL59981.1 hypothetical protein OXH18_22870 [Thermocoleostomius sinensis A174]